MGRGKRLSRWCVGGFSLLLACVEPARSADVPPEQLAPGVASAATSVATSALAPPGRVVIPPPLKPRDPKPEAADTETVSTFAGAAHEEPREPGYEVGNFFGKEDGPARDALTHGTPMKIERGRGGRSLGFKITLDNGQTGYFKGEQTFSAANWFGEVAAFHLDRMLGLGRVPTVVSREFPWSRLQPAAGRDVRRAEMIIRNGTVRGAFVAWVDGGLRPLVEIEGWLRWIRVKFWPSTAVSPFQRPAVWKRDIEMSRRLGNDWRTKEERLRRRNLKPEPDREDRPAELSDLIVFDYLTRNIDRWGGENANVLVRASDAALVCLDNGAGFEPGEARPSLMEARLHVIQRFRRRTISAVRAFELKRFEDRLASEPVQPVLSRAQLNALEERRKALLEWIAEMESEHGEAIWAWE
jgi:hypothetical protein